MGDTAIQMFREFGNVRVLALEPAARTYVYLCWNLALNGVPILDEGSFRAGRPGARARAACSSTSVDEG